MVEKLTHSEHEQIRQIFQFFDQDGDGTVATNFIALIMKNLGQTYSQDEIDMLQREVDPGNAGCFKFPEFLHLVASKLEDTSNVEQLRSCLSVFEDKEDEGMLHASELRFYLTTIGDKLSDEEVTELYRELTVDDDEEINIDEIIDVLKSGDFKCYYNRHHLQLPPFTDCVPREESVGCLTLPEIESVDVTEEENHTHHM